MKEEIILLNQITDSLTLKQSLLLEVKDGSSPVQIADRIKTLQFVIEELEKQKAIILDQPDV